MRNKIEDRRLPFGIGEDISDLNLDIDSTISISNLVKKYYQYIIDHQTEFDLKSLKISPHDDLTMKYPLSKEISILVDKYYMKFWEQLPHDEKRIFLDHFSAMNNEIWINFWKLGVKNYEFSRKVKVIYEQKNNQKITEMGFWEKLKYDIKDILSGWW